jgi:hypothetical protein
MGRGDGMRLETTARPSLRLVHAHPDDATPAGAGIDAQPHPKPQPARISSVEQPRMPGTTGGWRLLRGGVVGFAATALAVGGHCLSSDRPPTWPTVVCWTVLLACASTWLSRVRWTLPRLLGVLFAGQAGMHATFVATQPQPSQAHAHVHGASPAEALVPTDLSMVAGHIAAAAVTAALLRWGEGWLCGVLDALALRAYRVLEDRKSVV